MQANMTAEIKHHLCRCSYKCSKMYSWHKQAINEAKYKILNNNLFVVRNNYAKGSFTTLAFSILSRTCMKISESNAASAVRTYPRPMALPRLGD